jgi:hypothetical protein
MEPVLTLPYSEWLVAEQLMKNLPAKNGYSVFAPLSRQQKGVDLILARRLKEKSRVVTLQVKYSRAYEKGPKSKYTFLAWFKVFKIPDEADVFALTVLYPNITGKGTEPKKSLWKPLVLLIPKKEMIKIANSLQTKAGNPDVMFYLEFDDSKKVFLTRGLPSPIDLSFYLLENQLEKIEKALSRA